MQLLQQFQQQYDTIIVLACAGLAGSYFRVVYSPQRNIKLWLAQVVAGLLIAIFLGDAVAIVINKMFNFGISAYLVSGFLLGASGEAFVKKIQTKYLSEDK